MATLLSYLTTTRFLLHDSNAVMFTDLQLVNCINLARDRVVSDCLVPQVIAQIPLVSGQEAYSYPNVLLPAVQSLVPSARTVVATVGVNFLQTQSLKIPLEPLPWTDLNERYRLVPINSLPEAFGTLSKSDWLYIEPAPSGINWFAEIRCTYLGQNLVNYSDVESVLPSPLCDTLVPILAAVWAESFNDDEDGADKFEAKYERNKANMMAADPPWAVVPYSSIY